MTGTVKERPILFSGPMVRAILEGRKTVTRRVVRPQPAEQLIWRGDGTDRALDPDAALAHPCPYGKVGDRLWVRETFAPNPYDDTVWYRATDELPKEYGPLAWRPSIHMPRWASRIMLELTDVRVERVQEMQAADDLGEAAALAEGLIREDDHIGPLYGLPGQMTNRTAYAAFARLWDSINAKRGYGWEENPWVFVIEFKRVQP